MARTILPPVLATFILCVIAALTVWLQQPLLAPSLGAAVFSQVLHADEKSAAPYNLAAGQLIGAIAGVLGVVLAGQTQAHPLIGTHGLPAGRILAVAIAVLLAIVGRCSPTRARRRAGPRRSSSPSALRRRRWPAACAFWPASPSSWPWARRRGAWWRERKAPHRAALYISGTPIAGS